MAIDLADLEGDAAWLLREFDPSRPPGARALIERHLGPGSVIVANVRRDAQLATVGGRRVVVVRPRLGPEGLRWSLLHELAEWHLDGRMSEPHSSGSSSLPRAARHHRAGGDVLAASGAHRALPRTPPGSRLDGHMFVVRTTVREMTTDPNFASRLSSLIAIAGLNYSALDKLAGLASGHAGQLARGTKARPEATTALALARVFGAELEWLIDGTGEVPSERVVRRAVSAALERLGGGHADNRTPVRTDRNGRVRTANRKPASGAA